MTLGSSTLAFNSTIPPCLIQIVRWRSRRHIHKPNLKSEREIEGERVAPVDYSVFLSGNLVREDVISSFYKARDSHTKTLSSLPLWRVAWTQKVGLVRAR